jgi:hypothetical protein
MGQHINVAVNFLLVSLKKSKKSKEARKVRGETEKVGKISSFRW